MANPNKFTAKEVLNKVLLDSSGNAVTANSVTSQEALNSVLDTTNNRLNMSLAGGTISGDVTISGDLTVSGGGSLSFDEIIEGTSQIKVTDTSAFLVEKADGTDVFVVDTTNSRANLGARVGTAILEVKGAVNNDYAGRFENTDSGGYGALVKIAGTTTDDLAFQVRADSTNILTINGDSSSTFGGIVGIEVTPETDWRSSNVTALQVGAGGTVFARKDAGETKIFIAENVKWTSDGFEYINNGSAGYHGLDGGTHTFAVAGSGSADAVASFTTALTINNDGSSTFGGKIKADSSTSSDIITFSSSSDSTDNVVIKNFASGNFRWSQLDINHRDGSSVDTTPFSYAPRNADIKIDSVTGHDLILLESGGNVGIGASSPDGTLHVHTATAGTVTADTWADDLVVENSGDGGISILTPSANQGAIAFGSPVDANRAQITYQHSTDTMIIKSGGNTALTIDSSQNATFSGDVILSKTTNSAIYQDDSSEFLRLGVGGSGNDTPRIEIFGKDYGGADAGGNINIVSGGDGDATSGHILFGADQGAFVEHMRITNDGNVGIGVTPEADWLPTRTALQIGGSGAIFGATSAGAGGTLQIGQNVYFHSGGSYRRIDADEVSMYTQRDGTHTFKVAGSSTDNSTISFTDVAKFDINSRISLSNNDSGDYNTTLGYKAGNAIGSSSAEGVFIGHNAGLLLASGDGNTVIGYDAFKSADGAEGSNVVIGKTAGQSMNHDSSNQNVIIGAGAMSGGTAQQDKNVAVGYFALGSVANNAQTGTVAIGSEALGALTSGANNVAVGQEALHDVNTGGSNTAVGNFAGDNITDGIENTCIGYASRTSSASAQNQIVIGRATIGQADNSVTLGNSSVNSIFAPTKTAIQSYGIVAITDGSTITLAGNNLGAAILCIYEGSGGIAGVYALGYLFAAVELAGDANTSTSDTPGKVCVINGTNNHTVTIKNNTGQQRNFRIMVYSAAFN